MTTYESTDRSSTPDVVYTPIQTPEHVYENAVAEHDYENPP